MEYINNITGRIATGVMELGLCGDKITTGSGAENRRSAAGQSGWSVGIA